LDFFSAAVSGIEKPADRRHQDEDKNNGMKLEEEEKHKRPSYQRKYSDEDDPERIIARVLPLGWRGIFGPTIGTFHFLSTPGKSIPENAIKKKIDISLE